MIKRPIINEKLVIIRYKKILIRNKCDLNRDLINIYKMIKILIYFLFLSSALGIYSDDDVFYCYDDLTDEELSEKIKVQPLDQYIFLIVCNRRV